MRYKLLGRSGLRVSELALGTMTFGDDWGWGADATESRRMLESFLEAGGNFVDTSNNYTNGSSERILGELMRGDRDHFVVATKYTLTERPSDPNFGGNHRKNLLRSVKGSLERLQTDHIDLLWLHMWDGTTPLEEIMRALDDLVRLGTVHYVGFSDTPAWVVARADQLATLRGWASVAALQVNYNLAFRHAERDLLPMARALGLTVTPWGLLEGGALSGKFAAANPDSKRNDHPSEAMQAVVDTVVRVAQELERTPSQVAINWTRQQDSSIVPILGARTDAQLRDNLRCLEFRLSDAHLRELSDSSPIQLGFPHSFLASNHVRQLIFGETYAQLEISPRAV
jgi:aryl-alcohol dehydrogenase-like predicted oxidoreductase